MPIFEVSAHMTVRPGQLEGFKKQANECVRIIERLTELLEEEP